MSTKLTPQERDEIKTFVSEVVAATVKAAAPHIIEMIASAKAGIKYTRVGDQCVIEPVDPLEGLDLTMGPLVTGEEFQPIGGRDYRKQVWAQTYDRYVTLLGYEDAAASANQAVKCFDEAFPK